MTSKREKTYYLSDFRKKFVPHEDDVLIFDVAYEWGFLYQRINSPKNTFTVRSGKQIDKLIWYLSAINRYNHADNVWIFWAKDKYHNHNTTAKLAFYKGRIFAELKKHYLKSRVIEIEETIAFNFLRTEHGAKKLTPLIRIDKKQLTWDYFKYFLDTHNTFSNLPIYERYLNQDVADAWMLYNFITHSKIVEDGKNDKKK